MTTSPTNSGGRSRSSRHVTGVIVRRSCLGKRLSFADIRCSSITEDGEDEVKNNNTGIGSGDGDNDGNSTAAVIEEVPVVKVAFKRPPESAWNDEESPTPFPVKTSDLPYGAVVCLELLDCDPDNKTTVVYDVVTWKILQDPKQTAESIATVGGGRGDQKQHSSAGGGGGLSYSTYLRERGNQFSKHTIKGQKISQDHQQNKVMKKKKKNGEDREVEEEGNRNSNNNDNSNSNSMKRPRMTQQRQHPKQLPTTGSTGESNDDLAEADGGHGDKVVKAMRARLFAQWLLETFGSDALRGRGRAAGDGGGVVDVAGGKGHLSIELAVTGTVPCVMIDPMIRKKHCCGDTNNSGGTTTNFPVKRDAKRIRKAGGPLPRHIPTFFNQTTFLEQYGKRRNDEDDVGSSEESHHTGTEEGKSHGNNKANNNSVIVDSYLIENCTTLVGLHPDQTTQDILEIALRYNKSVAIVPCCVFPSFFPLRQLKDGTYVNTYTQFCQYLCEMDPTLKQAVLPFAGRNVVIYRKVLQESMKVADGDGGCDCVDVGGEAGV